MPGTLGDRYELDGVVGRGGMAEVYLAMTRGQNSLAIGLDSGLGTGLSEGRQGADSEAAADTGITAAARMGKVTLVVISASVEEQAEHDRVKLGQVGQPGRDERHQSTGTTD